MQIGKRMMMGAGGPKLPYDAEVEYIESTGTQWIDTGILPTVNTKAIADVQFTRIDTTQVCGAIWIGPPINAFDICGISNGSWFMRALTAGSPIPSGWTADTKRHLFTCDAKTHTASVDDVSITRTAIGLSNPIAIYVFIRHEPYTRTYPCLSKFFSLRIWDDITIVRDFIPVRFTNELGQSEGAMYDRLGVGGMNPDGSPRTDGLYRNRGTGAFTIGPDVG